MNKKSLLVIGLVGVISLCVGCAKYEQAKNDYAEQQGLDTGLFDLWPGGSLEGGSLEYVSWQDGLAVFEHDTPEGRDWACLDTNVDWSWRKAVHHEESRLCQQFLSSFNLTVSFGDRQYAAYVESISPTTGVASIRLDYD